MTEYRLRQIYQLTDNTKDGWSDWKPLPESLDITNEWGYTQMQFRPDPQPEQEAEDMDRHEYTVYLRDYDIVRQQHNINIARRQPLPPGAM